MASIGSIDFATIRRTVSLEQVLAHYKVLPTLSGGGAQRKGPDPFGMATPGKSKPFSVNLEKNVWTLFRGNHPESGSVLDFVMRKECCGVRQAALKLVDWFNIGTNAPASNGAADDAATRGAQSAEERKGNPPLAFQLKGLDPHGKRVAWAAVSALDGSYAAATIGVCLAAAQFHGSRSSMRLIG
ncbi:MAG: hypothetical protein ACKVQT_31885 [Burkholderiales bacterium]